MISNGNFQMWEGGQSEAPLRLWRVCPCRTCQADAKDKGVGYLLTSDSKGWGVTIWVPNEFVYQRLVDCGIKLGHAIGGNGLDHTPPRDDDEILDPRGL